MKKFVCINIILFINCLLIKVEAQSIFNKWRQISVPERRWVILHPFTANKAWKFTQIAKHTTDSIRKTQILWGIGNADQVDAFRHAYWMALLSKNLSYNKAISLGKAHEKANYLDYKKHKTEDGALPDKIASEMDLWNNKIGANIGIKAKKLNNADLISLIIKAIDNGDMRIILMDQQRNFLNCQNQIIPADSLKGKWQNNKCLVPSNKIP